MNFVVQHVIVNVLDKQIEFRQPCSRAYWFRQKPPVYNHLLECEHFNRVVNLHSLPPSNNSVEYLKHVKMVVYGNIKIIDNSQNWILKKDYQKALKKLTLFFSFKPSPF